jgi:MFS transporter, MHS family, citrate/tricarballylate:H+ symporter
MSGTVKRTRTRDIIAAVIGNGLEAYDFVIYSFFALQIAQTLFPATNPSTGLLMSLATFGVGFLSRPVGALVIGLYSDRMGRRPAMFLSLALMGIATIAFAFIPSYHSIGIAAPIAAVLCRLLQGFALGGEIGSNTTFLMESAPAGRRGRRVSWQAVGQLIAVLIASAIGLLLSTLLSAAALSEYGWRIAFLVGALTLPVGLVLRAGLEKHSEAAVDLTNSLAPEDADSGNPLLRTARSEWRLLLLGLIIVGSGTAGSYVSVYTVTYAQTSLGLTAKAGFTAQMANMMASIPIVLLGGWLSDRIGRWRVNVFGNLLFLVTAYPVFAWIVSMRTETALIIGVVLLGITGNINTASLYAALTESLPKTIRATSYGLVYAVSMAVIGGGTQLFVTYIIDVTGNPMAVGWYLTAAIAIGLVGMILLRESSPLHIANRETAR